MLRSSRLGGGQSDGWGVVECMVVGWVDACRDPVRFGKEEKWKSQCQISGSVTGL